MYPQYSVVDLLGFFLLLVLKNLFTLPYLGFWNIIQISNANHAHKCIDFLIAGLCVECKDFQRVYWWQLHT